jgi:hypothetical protein
MPLPAVEHRFLCRPTCSPLIYRLSYSGSSGRAIAQGVSRWFPTVAARVRTRVWQVEFVVDEVALGQMFSEYFGFPCQSSFHQKFSIITITRGRYSRSVCGWRAEWTQFHPPLCEYSGSKWGGVIHTHYLDALFDNGNIQNEARAILWQFNIRLRTTKIVGGALLCYDTYHVHTRPCYRV